MQNYAPILKAITGAVVAALTAASVGADDGHFSWADGIATAIAFFVGLGAVWAVPNQVPAEPTQLSAPTPTPARNAPTKR